MGNIPSLIVSEIYGPTIQGEGLTAGRVCHFLRLAGCNLACVWCDTPYTWDWSRFDPKTETRKIPVRTVAEEIRNLGGNTQRLVISGGEPMLQSLRIAELIHNLVGWDIEIETAGTVPVPIGFPVCQFNVSPKLGHSGNSVEKRRSIESLNTYKTKGTIWKFVAGQVSDFMEIDYLVETVGMSPVYIMPLTLPDMDHRLTAMRLLPSIMERNYRLSARLHVDLWGTKRGV